MSDAREKLKKENEVRKPDTIATREVDYTLREIQRKEQEVKEKIKRKQEEIKRKKDMVKEEQRRIVKEVTTVIDARRGDEARDSSTYFNLARKYKDLPTVSKLFQELSEAEDSHQKKLLLLGNELERKLKEVS